MSKITKVKRWLTPEEAVSYLHAHTGESLSSQEFLSLCQTEGQCRIYTANDDWENLVPDEALLADTRADKSEAQPDTLIDDHPYLFQRTDLDALIARMNTPAYPAEIQALRQQLKTEQAARKKAERRVKELESDKPSKSHLLIIAGLLELLLEEKGVNYNQDRVLSAFEERDWPGASTSTVSKIFPRANDAKEAAKKAKLRKKLQQN